MFDFHLRYLRDVVPTLANEKRTRLQGLSLVGRVVIALGLAAGFLAGAPGTAGLAMTREGIRSGCGPYWEFFFAHNPGAPQIGQGDCPTAGAAGGQPDPGASRNKEIILALNAESQRIFLLALVPVTGGVTRPDRGSSWYCEYFFAHTPDGPQNAPFAAPLVIGQASPP